MLDECEIFLDMPNICKAEITLAFFFICFDFLVVHLGSFVQAHHVLNAVLILQNDLKVNVKDKSNTLIASYFILFFYFLFCF